MNDTPETDACKSATRGESIFDLCERLERERNEAQRELEMWKFERDEALEHAARYRLEANKLIMMGIELREQNAKLRDIAERAIGGLESKYKLHCGADIQLGIRAELDQLKEGVK